MESNNRPNHRAPSDAKKPYFDAGSGVLADLRALNPELENIQFPPKRKHKKGDPSSLMKAPKPRKPGSISEHGGANRNSPALDDNEAIIKISRFLGVKPNGKINEQ